MLSIIITNFKKVGTFTQLLGVDVSFFQELNVKCLVLASTLQMASFELWTMPLQ